MLFRSASLLIISTILFLYMPKAEDHDDFLEIIIRAIPKLSIIVIYAILMDYILNTLNSRIYTGIKTMYNIMRKLIKVFLIIMLIFAIGYLLYLFLEKDKINLNHYYRYFIYCCFATTILVGIFSVVVIIIYFKNLRKYPVTLMCTKPNIQLLIVGIFLQIIASVWDFIFNIMKYWSIILESSKRFPFYDVIGFIYFSLNYIIPIMIYTMYFKTDSKNITLMMGTSVIIQNTQAEENEASIIENKLMKSLIIYESMKSSYSFGSNINGLN